ncbi:MAG: hypothetical protein ACYTX0_36990 [Nostoc sp.]
MPTAGCAYALFYRSDVCDEEGDKPNGIASLREAAPTLTAKSVYCLFTSKKGSSTRFFHCQKHIMCDEILHFSGI